VNAEARVSRKGFHGGLDLANALKVSLGQDGALLLPPVPEDHVDAPRALGVEPPGSCGQKPLSDLSCGRKAAASSPGAPSFVESLPHLLVLFHSKPEPILFRWAQGGGLSLSYKKLPVKGEKDRRKEQI
jgi:hypothetical protein